MSVLLFKSIHVGCAAASYALFLLRGIWMLHDSPLLRQRWTGSVPHIIDTLLLASAIALAISIHRYPFVDAWLTAKVLSLLLYIALGSIALKHGKRKVIRLTAWLAAQGVFFYIVLVAVSHSPAPFIH